MKMVRGQRDSKGRFTKGFSYLHSESSKAKISIAHKGKILSSEHKKKLSKAHQGKKLSEETKQKISELGRANPARYWLGRKKGPMSEATKKKLSEAKKGKKLSPEHIRKMSLGLKGKPQVHHRGANSHWWKGGVTSINKTIKNSLEYKLWRESVFKRDNWSCKKCKVRGGMLHPHHIKSFAHYPLLRFKVENGVTLCKGCHKKTDTYAKP